MVDEEKDLTPQEQADPVEDPQPEDPGQMAEVDARQDEDMPEAAEVPLAEAPTTQDDTPPEDEKDLSEPADQTAEENVLMGGEMSGLTESSEPDQAQDLDTAEIEEKAAEDAADSEAPSMGEIESDSARLDVDEADAPAASVDESGVDAEGRAWYVVHCYSGYENKVRHNLEQRIESMGMKDMIFDVVVPTEEEIEVKEGKRRTVERRVFPGYILVNMVMTEESWYVVRNTPGVTSFVGQGNEPLPLRPEEVAQIVKRMEAEAPRIKVTFRQGERVRIVDGPFNDFRGTVSEIDMERAKVRVMVNFFGRETPVELDFLQVEKA